MGLHNGATSAWMERNLCASTGWDDPAFKLSNA